jgi:DNA helicase-2/ATP-dependent DNA helicase PcrA
LEFYQRKEIKDVLAYLHLINNPCSDVALRRVINTPPRSIGQRTVQQLVEYAEQEHLCLLDAARRAGLIESLAKRSAVRVAKFVALYDKLVLLAVASLEEIIGHVLSQTGYIEWLKSSPDPQDQERLANVQELVTDGREFDMQHPDQGQLEEFLERASLVSDTDEWELESDRVSLMTLHAAKGLEFPVVHIVALEEGLLPHELSREDADKLQEERRLLFVGITRAREELQLSCAQRRLIHGTSRLTIASSFLMELPRERMDVYGPPSGHRDGADREWQDEDEWQDDLSIDEGDASGEDWSDGRQAQPNSGPAPEAATPTSASVMTAADMLAGPPESSQPLAVRPRISPESFHQGMVVRHCEYGLGKVIALSGEGAKRSATVQFFDSTRPRKFMLAHSSFEPIRSPGTGG